MMAHETVPSHRLLVVDHEQGTAQALRQLFERAGHEALIAATGEEALALLEAHEVSLIISSQRMPGMTGAEFLAEARKRRPEALRILLTGSSDIQAAAEAINEGRVYRFLPKPWEEEALLATVDRALAAFDEKRAYAALQERIWLQYEQLRELKEDLERKVLQRTQDLEKALRRSEDLNETLRHQNLATVKVLSGLLELRSPALGAHCRRVAALAPGVCTKLGLTDRHAVQEILIAALLHDLGKLAFSDALLIKDASHLGPQEREELRKHPVLGQGQLQVVESLSEVARMIRHHHENVDGSGYPDGLRGVEIPLGARILRALDAYDNVTRGRAIAGTAATHPLAALENQVLRAFDETVFSALHEALRAGPPAYDPAHETRVRVEKLEEGMVLSQDLRTHSGVLLVAKHETIRKSYIEKIRNLRAIYTTDDYAYVYRQG